VRIPERERTRDGLLAVLADGSTDEQVKLPVREGGEVRPKRPTGGKKKPGITFSETNHGRDTDPTNRVTIKSESAAGNHL